MTIAKIIRHRHYWEYSINGTVKSVDEKVEFKIVFSEPSEMRMFEEWVKQNKGEYKYDKEKNEVEGELPKMKIFEPYKEGLCWCDIMQYYLLHIAGYEFHSALSPYTGEIYHRIEAVAK